MTTPHTAPQPRAEPPPPPFVSSPRQEPGVDVALRERRGAQIGRASCRERV